MMNKKIIELKFLEKIITFKGMTFKISGITEEDLYKEQERIAFSLLEKFGTTQLIKHEEAKEYCLEKEIDWNPEMAAMLSTIC